MDPQAYWERIKKLTIEAGQTALRLINNNIPSIKGDHSVVTTADKAIAQLAHEQLADLLKTPDHILIEEEDPQMHTYLNQSLLEKTPYLWSIDPIDGTRLYANGIPYFAVSIGLLKNLRPWMGAVYFPRLNELFYCDGQKAFFVQHPFTASEQKMEIVPREEEITYKSIFLSNDKNFRDYSWDYRNCQILISGCASVDLCWPAIGRSCGATFKSCLWDFAGSWPIFEAAGLKLRAIQSGRVLEELHIDLVEGNDKPWRVKDYYILSSEKNFSVLKKKLEFKNNF